VVRFRPFCDAAWKGTLILLGLFLKLMTFCDILRPDFDDVLLILNELNMKCTEKGAGFFRFI